MRGRFIDLTGHRFGRLVVLRRISPSRRRHRPDWLCQCDCGQTALITGMCLRTGDTRSCGCLQREVAWQRKHGQSKTVLHRIWRRIRNRCENPRNDSFAEYGGRGIYVCERWKQFVNFAADMGERPSPRHSVDRIDNDGPYAPENCRWATPHEQMRNTSRNHWIEFGGYRLVQKDWAHRLGISSSTLEKRLRNWPLERALTEPIHEHCRR